MPAPTPSHVILVGPMGAGKSSIGRLLAARLRLAFTDLDARIEAEAGRPIATLFASEGEGGFRDRERRALAEVLQQARPSVIATGGGAVLDAGSRAAMRAAGTVVYLQVDPAAQLQRLADDVGRPLLAGDDRAGTLLRLQQQREPLYIEVADLAFDTTAHSPESAALALERLIADLSGSPA